MRITFLIVICCFLSAVRTGLCAEDGLHTADFLSTGELLPAFDHLGAFGGQLDAAIASRCTLVYATGIGQYSYNGLPPRKKLDEYCETLRSYNRKGHAGGVRVMLSYLCATSIVRVNTFAENWDDYFPNRPADFTPSRMLQQDIEGKNLPSWYGGDYSPADMWNPYWREYTRFTIKLAVESGHDGVFFDNPTVHVHGNYSPHAMRAWARFLAKEGVPCNKDDIAALRGLTRSHEELWLRFRVTESADFFREMQEYGRSLKPDFVLTVNNSLNTWDSFYSQPRSVAYSIPSQSRYEDLVTIEDMSSQPRRQGDQSISYGSTLRLIHAVANGRPLSVCTIDGNYTTPPNLTKLAIAECTAHDAAYMVWSCWDEAFRRSNAAVVAEYHQFIKDHVGFVARSCSAADVLLIWPYNNWLRRADCPTALLARELSRRNVQYDVLTEADLTPKQLKGYRDVVSSAQEELQKPSTRQMLAEFERGGGTVLDPNSLDDGRTVTSVRVVDHPLVRAVVRRDSKGSPLLHLYNLDVSLQDRYHDTVTPATELRVSWWLPSRPESVHNVVLSTPDAAATQGALKCDSTLEGDRIRIDLVIPKLWIWTIVTLQ